MTLISSRTNRRTYCPYSFKWQLVDWVVENKKFRRSTANQMTKRQLYAIWYQT